MKFLFITVFHHRDTERGRLRLIKNGVFKEGNFKSEPISKYVTSIAIPGLGTGVGAIGPNTCAKQVRSAIDDILLDKYEFPLTWADAQERHQRLYRDWIRDLQKDE